MGINNPCFLIQSPACHSSNAARSFRMLENMGWIIAGIVGVVGWAIHAMKISHNYGSLNQRVKTLEDTAGDHREVRDSMIRMEGRLQAMESTLTELKEGLVWMTKSAPMYGPPGPAPRSRSAK